MSKYSPPGVSEVHWVVTVSSYTAITASEANAGTDLTSFVRTLPDFPRTGNTMDVATLDSKFEKRAVGTRGGDVISMEILRDDTTDTAYTTLTEDTAGYLVVPRKGLTTAGTFATGDEVDVFASTVLAVSDGNPGRNDPDFAVVELVVTDDYRQAPRTGPDSAELPTLAHPRGSERVSCRALVALLRPKSDSERFGRQQATRRFHQ